MKQKGANLIAGTVKVYLDEKLLDKTEVQELDNGFIAITHTNLSGVQVMKVTYDVTMEKSSWQAGISRTQHLQMRIIPDLQKPHTA